MRRLKEARRIVIARKYACDLYFFSRWSLRE
jgi:hypothetical protein